LTSWIQGFPATALTKAGKGSYAPKLMKLRVLRKFSVIPFQFMKIRVIPG